MGAVVLIALGVLFFVMGPALVLVLVLAVRQAARASEVGRVVARGSAGRVPVASGGRHHRR
ncbi:hypothetical protein LTV02_01285 [Nocardia yamanashiensis]|uniref:hypothetical protein n=1 Tax=Nocardia yamanashiensis TaxID=209247 RepID=UPI001E473408|nr:hypothetical protein [Nocardia yamanashiensis]UGT42094.1 hypothetical protein LTV02_01285 [Nocardia yamanashiensis]